MAKTLIENLNSSYFTAAHQLYSKKTRHKIVAYVESYDDIAFWRMLLEDFETDEYYFEVMLPSSTSLSKGKKMVLMNTLNVDELGKSLIACVDSDYDFLLQGATSTSRKINDNKYIFQTYAYAIENYHCYADGLHEVCVQSTLNDKRLFDFNDFMKRYSQIAYSLFLWSVWFSRLHDTHTFPMNDFNSYVRVRNLDIRHPEQSLERMKKDVLAKLAQLKAGFPQYVDSVDSLAVELKQLGLVPETTYLYIQGHHIMDDVVMKLLTPVCSVLRREREQEIKNLALHEEQYQNELTSYENSQIGVEVMLRRNNGYKDLYLYRWLQDDVREFMKGK
ncbi:DUF4435 domain-containing protein [uncultured Bacteroides sp.]|uniref:DUF4435 domain-containing protein n=1 Tax=uncultured Bacteroides sp. TaxID=162156 RepID=UPI002AA73D49|nr:DUF4435 domain-containing protein [uncultured Bacteroides sp.]